MSEIANIEGNSLYLFSKEVILVARKKIYETANFAMVETYWQIGKKIIEEQGGMQYATYGEGLLKSVSEQLQKEFGKGFTYANLTNK